MTKTWIWVMIVLNLVTVVLFASAILFDGVTGFRVVMFFIGVGLLVFNSNRLGRYK